MLVPFWMMTLPMSVVPQILCQAPFPCVAAALDCFLMVITLWQKTVFSQMKMAT